MAKQTSGVDPERPNAVPVHDPVGLVKLGPDEHLGAPEPNVAALERMFFHIFGNTWLDEPEETARRVLQYWSEFGVGPMRWTFTTFPTTVQQMILVKDIAFESICSHHLLPFYGMAHVAYIPHSLMVGVSKVPRLVQYLAKRPRVQEELTNDIASYMKTKLDAKGVAVVLKARHTCMSCRGILARDAWMVTSEMRGVFLTAPSVRQEFLEMIR